MLEDLAFIQFWPGQIDATRDLLPIIVRPPDQPHLRFILGCVGMPWAAFCRQLCGAQRARRGRRGLQEILQLLLQPAPLCPAGGLGKIIGKPLLFSLSNSWAKFYQVDHHRKHDEMKGEF